MPSGPVGLVSGPHRTQTSMHVTFSISLVHASDFSTGPLSTSARDYIPLEQVEEGELSELDDQSDPDAMDTEL